MAKDSAPETVIPPVPDAPDMTDMTDAAASQPNEGTGSGVTPGSGNGTTLAPATSETTVPTEGELSPVDTAYWQGCKAGWDQAWQLARQRYGVASTDQERADWQRWMPVRGTLGTTTTS